MPTNTANTPTLSQMMAEEAMSEVVGMLNGTSPEVKTLQSYINTDAMMQDLINDINSI